MLNIASLLLYFFVTGYCIYFTYVRKEKITCMTGMMIAMTIGMMVSIAAGTVLGIMMDRQIVSSTIVSMIIGMVAGYASGRPVSLMAAMDGLMAGIMGGMMGAMLGVMLQPGSTTLLIMFINIVFLLIMTLLIKMIKEETVSKKKVAEIAEEKERKLNPILIIGIVVTIGFFGLLIAATKPSSTVSAFLGGGKDVEASQASVTSTLNGDFQEAAVEVSLQGYTPGIVKVQAGIPTKLSFKTGSVLGCLNTLIFSDLGMTKRLEFDSDNVVNLPALEPGTYAFSCGMGMYIGQLVVN